MINYITIFIIFRMFVYKLLGLFKICKCFFFVVPTLICMPPPPFFHGNYNRRQLFMLISDYLFDSKLFCTCVPPLRNTGTN